MVGANSFTQAPKLYSDIAGDEEKKVEVTTKVHADGIAFIEVKGRGSLLGMKAAAHSFEAGFAILPHGLRLKIVVDLSDFEGAPLAAQLCLVEWMIRHQKRFRYVAVLGGEAMVIKIAQKIQSLLPFGKRVGLFPKSAELKLHLEKIAHEDASISHQ